MQGWKGKVRKNRLIRWFGGMGISKRYRILFIVLTFYIIVWNGTNIYFDTLEIDDNSARYLLSALVQGQAAIIAIVVTMTLVAVQLTASAYSPRVIDIFKNDQVMWLLLVWYGLSMFFGLFVLETIGGKYSNLNPWCIAVSLESYVFLAYLMGILAFAGLFWHVGNVITLLKPENMIKRLAIKITTDRILDPKEGPVQPIMDIIHCSITKYDIAMVGYGLDAVMKKAVNIINISKYPDDEYIPGFFCGHLGTAGRCALHAGEDESAMKIIGCLEDIGRLAMHSDETAKIAVQYIEIIGTVAAEKKLRFVACDAVESLEVVGEFAAQNGLEDATSHTINSLGIVGMYAADNKIGIAAQDAAKYLGRVGMCAAKNELKNAAKQAADSLGVVGNYAAENKLKRTTSEAALSLEVVGTSAAEKGLKDATKQAVRSLGNVGKLAERNGLEGAVWQSLESLGQIGIAAAENELRHAAEDAAMDLRFFGRFAIEKGNEGAAKRAIWLLKKIGTTAGNGLEPVAWQAAESLGLVGMDAIEKGKGFEDVTNEVIYRLGSVGLYTEGSGLEKATKQVAQSFIGIGVFAVKNGLNDAAQEAAKSIAAISNEKLVAQAIHESESRLRAYGDSFQKFLNLYEHELKKPHPRNSN